MALNDENIRLRTGERIPVSALEFKTSRGGGPGGQHVNKVETKVEARLDLTDRPELREGTLNTLQIRLKHKLEADGTLRVVSAAERSQHANKATAIKRLEEILNKALTPVKKRVPTKPSKSSKKKRLEKKRQHSQKKAERRWKPGKE